MTARWQTYFHWIPAYAGMTDSNILPITGLWCSQTSSFARMTANYPDHLLVCRIFYTRHSGKSEGLIRFLDLDLVKILIAN
jgi:hypothetical protein